MKNRRSEHAAALARRLADLEAKRIDELYGLEPVYEPGASGGPEEFVAFRCPWCGERLEARIDLTAGAHACVEDCQVCCKPMELTVELAENGTVSALRVERLG